MISALYVINAKGEIVINRVYRDDVSRASADAFRLKVITKKETSGPPVVLIDGCSFMYTRRNDLYIVAVSRSNVNPALVFQFVFQLANIFVAYFGEKFDEESLKSNFTLVYELLDETLDYGYPQNCAIDVLQLYINLGALKTNAVAAGATLTSQITGAIDWRRQDIKHRKNECFIDVLESVNLLLSVDGNVLRSDVSGQVMVKTYLTGMPECKFGLNDKLILDREAQAKGAKGGAAGGGRKSAPAVELDDCTFHRCVRLGKFDADRTITFIPPDGEFELMRYRITENVNLPFRVIPVVEERGKTRVSYNIKVIANFSSKLFATPVLHAASQRHLQPEFPCHAVRIVLVDHLPSLHICRNVVFKIPCPNTTARVKTTQNTGRAKYEPSQHAIVWRVRRFAGGAEYSFTAEAELISSTREKAWSRPPITVEFQVPMFTASGLHVRFLKVFEKNNYTTTKWVRYITRAGQYQIRI